MFLFFFNNFVFERSREREEACVVVVAVAAVVVVVSLDATVSLVFDEVLSPFVFCKVLQLATVDSPASLSSERKKKKLNF